jgi:hypothetical protein
MHDYRIDDVFEFVDKTDIPLICISVAYMRGQDIRKILGLRSLKYERPEIPRTKTPLKLLPPCLTLFPSETAFNPPA